MKCSLCLVVYFILVGSLFAGDKKPNIVVILADDLGYAQTGYNGHQYARTPNIDSIVYNGVKFTDGYNAASVCSPSRAGLMTGKYPTRFGCEFNAGNHRCGMPTSQQTLANRLRRLGYQTAIIGKWDLGTANLCYLPTSRGFDVFYGTSATSPLFVPWELRDSQRPLGKTFENGYQETKDPNFYVTTACANRAVQWMKEQNAEKPIFLYLPFDAVHPPLEAPQAYLDRFADVPDPMRTFCATLSAMDDAIGMVLEELKLEKRYDNTLIFFLSDNGGPGCTPGMPVRLSQASAPFRGSKSQLLEGGIRVPFAAQWPDHIPKGLFYHEPVINLDIVPTAVAAAGGTCEADVDGVDLMPYLTKQKEGVPHEALYWRYGPEWAIRQGDWKLVVDHEKPRRPRLYNLRDDMGEEWDLRWTNLDRTKQLQDAWNVWDSQQIAPLWPPGKPLNGGDEWHQTGPNAGKDIYKTK